MRVLKVSNFISIGKEYLIIDKNTIRIKIIILECSEVNNKLIYKRNFFPLIFSFFYSSNR